MFEQTEDQRAKLQQQALDFAGRYVRSFDRELLDHWYKTIVERVLPPNATHAEHAYHEGQRALIVGIIRQYQFAMTGNLETPWQTIPQPPQQQPQPKAQRPRRPRTPAASSTPRQSRSKKPPPQP